MKPLQMNKLAGACVTALLVGGIMLHVSPAIAATAAGTQIKNLATVTYQDENGNTYSAQSNEAVITVKQVYAAELGVDTTKTAAAGQMVYSQHTLTNNGNGEDTYTLNVADITGDDLTADSIQVFIDSNGNGLADAGETMVAAGGTVTLAGGQSSALVMAVKVPATATAGDELFTKLTATTSNGSVVDLTSSGGYDSANNTNHTLITVANDAVLNYTKSAVLDAATNRITYTLTVSNTGNEAATDVSIYDALPVDNSGIPLTLVSVSASGLLGANNDELMGQDTSFSMTSPAANDLDEAALGIDLNSKSGATETLKGISAFDKSLASGQTISLSFVVQYDPGTFNNNSIAGSAGDIIKNTGYLSVNNETIPSNPTQTVLPQIYGVVADDTGDAANSAPHNDGLDDNVADDVQLVTTAPPGSSVWFSVDVTNDGTGRDTFELTTSGSSFPAGTVFTYWNESGTVQLVDTNSKGGIDTGMLESGDNIRIVVKAQLPTNAANGGTVTLTATSATAPTTVSDTTTLQLQAISAAGVDLFDNTGSAGTPANEDALGTAPYNINHGTNPGTRQAMATTVGSTVKIPLYIDNGSGSSDSFQFSIGSSWNGTTVGGLPTGWSALFYKADASGNPTGSPLTSTALLPAGSLGNAATNQYVAVVTIPNDPAYALADYLADNNGDGTPDMMDANADGDGDQPVFIRIKSANSGASDIMLDAIDVENLAQVELTPPGSNQIQPGGSVDYINTLDNTGNTTETLELTSANSLSGASWGNTVKVDTNGDGIPDKTLAELQPGDVIKGVDVAGNVVNIPVTDADNDGNPEVTMNPGEKFDLTPTVFAPSSAAPGQTDVLTLYATNTGTGPSASVEDVSIVILGQVRLDKQVAIDADCDGTHEGTFQANLTTEVAPNECAIWQIQSENQGDALAKNVIIRDKVPAYSTYEMGSLKYCLNLGCAPAAVTNEGEIVGSDIAFYVGTGSVPASQLGGDLQPGQQATVWFSTKVQ